MKRILKWAGIVLLSALLLGSIGFVIWAEAAAGPGPAALAALKSDDSVAVSVHNGIVIFQPAKFQATTGFIFYPGGRVEYRSYAPILHKIAAEGYFVALVPVRLNLAFFDIEAGAPVLKDFPQIQFWVTGGHSLGGVASALFAEKHPEIRGIVFWASYSANDGLKTPASRPSPSTALRTAASITARKSIRTSPWSLPIHNLSSSKAPITPNLAIMAPRAATTPPPSPPNCSGSRLPGPQLNFSACSASDSAVTPEKAWAGLPNFPKTLFHRIAEL